MYVKYDALKNTIRTNI